MSTSPMTFDMALETEEFVTAEEFLRRRERGGINPAEVRYVFDQPGEPFGGFRIKLKQPRYKVLVGAFGGGGIGYAIGSKKNSG